MIEILNENEETEIIGGTIPVQAFATNIEVNPGISTYLGETDPVFKASAAYNITNSDIISWNNKASEGYVDTKLMTKQDTLVSGTNIKTINNESILGSGNIEIEGVTNYNELENKPKINNVELSGNKSLNDLGIDLSSKQDTLESGTNIKTINNNSLLGSGNINIEAPEYSAGVGINIDNRQEISVKLGQGLFIDDNAAIRLNNDTLNKLESIATKQNTLVSGENIKTINNNSLLGSGNLEIGGGIDPTDLLNYIYPVGSIYMSVNNVSPQTFLGGTWQRIEDKFLLGASTTYSAGSTGGASTVALTVAQLPKHQHVVTKATTTYGPGNQSAWRCLSWAGTNHDYGDTVNSYDGTDNGLRGEAHENMPPYLSVYMWKRTA